MTAPTHPRIRLHHPECTTLTPRIDPEHVCAVTVGYLPTATGGTLRVVEERHHDGTRTVLLIPAGPTGPETEPIVLDPQGADALVSLLFPTALPPTT